MEPKDFKSWRRAMKLSQKEAAHALGLKRRMIQYYEKGERDGSKVTVPLSVRLACYAIGEGIADYNGPNRKIIMAPETEDHTASGSKANGRKPESKK